MKKFFTYFSLAVILAVGIYSATYMAGLSRTYNGKNTNVYQLSRDYQNYDIKDADGVTSIIIKEDLKKTHALNTVTSVTFDFRGYDTLGESFILLTAISGSMAILRNGKRRRKENEEKH